MSLKLFWRGRDHIEIVRKARDGMVYEYGWPANTHDHLPLPVHRVAPYRKMRCFSAAFAIRQDNLTPFSVPVTNESAATNSSSVVKSASALVGSHNAANSAGVQ
jgi:hypothetical protein